MATIAHDLNAKPRTKDVLIEEQLNFNGLLLSEATLQGLKNGGFKIPSPIQLKAIPIGKCGFDLMVESKSGTGKTVVFAVVALELLKLSNVVPQVLILAPTREVALQICEVLRIVGAGYNGLKVEAFIGGFPVHEDTKKLPKCHIVVGAPGRIKHLIQMGVLGLSSVKLLVLDEVDKLFEESFKSDVIKICTSLPRVKQTVAVSATYTDELKLNLEKLMYLPSFITPNTGSLLLLGLRQFISVVKSNLNVIQQINIKNEELVRLLQKVSFSQCIVFSNYQTRVESISNMLNRRGWKSTFISGAQSQAHRLEAIEGFFKNFKCRILLSTDLSARGLDASSVDLIINYDVPNDASTYLHRMGRAGRYGSHGACITLAADGKDLHNLQILLGSIGGCVMSVPKLPDGEIPADLLNCDSTKFEAVFGIVDVTKKSDGNGKLEISKSVMGIKNFKSNLISPTLDSDDINTDNVHMFLDMKNRKEKEIESKVADMKSHDLLYSLACGENLNIQNSSSMSDTVEISDACDSKKRKRIGREGDHTQNITEDTDDKTLVKNVALLNVTKLLDSDFCISNEENEVVHSRKQRTPHNTRARTLHDITDGYVMDFLQGVQEFEAKMAQGCHVGDDISLEEEGQLENVFKLGFDYAVGGNAPHWLDALGEEFQEKVDLTPDETDYIQAQEFSEEEFTHKKRNKHKRHNKKKKHSAYHHKENEVSSEPDLKGDKKFVQWYNKTHREDVSEVNYDYDPHYAHEYEYYNNKEFTNCFEYYNNELAVQAETFEDTASFSGWFSQWQYQVQGVRDYIQQNVYLQEMNRYALFKN